MSGDLAEFLLTQISEDETQTVASFGEDDSPGTWTRFLLAECAAKRAIIELHASSGDPSDMHMCRGESVEWLGIRNTNDGPHHYSIEHCRTLALLAAPYSDRPGFRPEWQVTP